MKVEIPELPGVQQALANIPGKLDDGIRQASAQARRLLIAALASYPPIPAGSRYTRTGRLGRAWERSSPAVGPRGFQLINPTEYGGLVQGDRQAWMHRGRWTPASTIAHEHEEEVMQLFEDATKQAVEP